MPDNSQRKLAALKAGLLVRRYQGVLFAFEQLRHITFHVVDVLVGSSGGAVSANGTPSFNVGGVSLYISAGNGDANGGGGGAGGGCLYGNGGSGSSSGVAERSEITG